MMKPIRLLVSLWIVFCASPSRAGEWVTPWPVVLAESDGCRARILISGPSPKKNTLCLSRSQWKSFLALRHPARLWIEPQTLKWKPVRMPTLDEPGTGYWMQARLEPQPMSEAIHEQPRSVGERLLIGTIQWIEQCRDRFSETIRPHDPDGWLRSWILNERPKGEASVLFGLGLVHILTTAGVHLVFLSRALGGLLGAIWPEVRTVRRLTVLAELGMFAWVWALAGCRFGMLRPLLYLSSGRVCRHFGLQIPAWGFVAVMVGLEVLVRGFEPWGVHYLAAILGGLWGGNLGSWLWVIPLQIVHDGSLSLFTPILSALTVPLAGAVFLPFSLLTVALPELAPLLGGLARLSLGAWTWVAKLPGSSWSVSGWALVPALMLAVGFTFACRRRPTGVAALLAFLVALSLSLFVSNVALPGRSSEVLQLDVGQGDAALVLDRSQGRWGGQVGMIDLGPERGVGVASWLAMFSRHQVTRLDWVVLTHLDEDHWGGLKRIAPWIRIGCVVVPPALMQEPKFKEVRLLSTRWGFKIQPQAAGCAPVDWAWVERDGGRRGPNSVMAGVRLRLGCSPDGGRGLEYINLGDAPGHGMEEALWSKLKGQSVPAPCLKRVFKVSHHGSRHSGATALLRSVDPNEIWISAGLANSYGHPHGDLLERLRSLSVPWRGTWIEGGISKKANENNIFRGIL